MRCEDLAAVLPELADPEVPVPEGGVPTAWSSLDSAAREHLESCLRCQAELARYRKLLRALQMLRSRSFEAPAGLLADTLVALELVAERRALRSALSGKRLAYAGAIGGATVAAGAAAVMIARSRHRQHRIAS